MKILTDKKQDEIAVLIITLQKELYKETFDYCRVLDIISRIMDKTLDPKHCLLVANVLAKHWERMDKGE